MSALLITQMTCNINNLNSFSMTFFILSKFTYKWKRNVEIYVSYLYYPSGSLYQSTTKLRKCARTQLTFHYYFLIDRGLLSEGRADPVVRCSLAQGG